MGSLIEVRVRVASSVDDSCERPCHARRVIPGTAGANDYLDPLISNPKSYEGYHSGCNIKPAMMKELRRTGNLIEAFYDEHGFIDKCNNGEEYKQIVKRSIDKVRNKIQERTEDTVDQATFQAPCASAYDVYGSSNDTKSLSRKHYRAEVTLQATSPGHDRRAGVMLHNEGHFDYKLYGDIM